MNTKTEDRKMLGTIAVVMGDILRSVKLKKTDTIKIRLNRSNQTVSIVNQKQENVIDLPKSLSDTLYPLLVNKRIEVDVYAEFLKVEGIQNSVAGLNVFLKDETILNPDQVSSLPEKFHQIVVNQFQTIDQIDDSSLLFQMHHQLLEMMKELKLSHSQLLPESELLLRLIYSKANICHGQEIQAVYNNACGKLESFTFGQPLKYGDIALYPVYRDEQMNDAVSLLDLPDDKRNASQANGLTIFNKSQNPLVVLEGESVHFHQRFLIHRTVIVPPKSRFSYEVSEDSEISNINATVRTPSMRLLNWMYDSINYIPTHYEESQHQTSNTEVFIAEKIKSKSCSLFSPCYGLTMKSEFTRIGQMLLDCANNAKYPKDACGYMVFRNGCFSMMEVYPNAKFLEQRWEMVLDAVVTDAAFLPLLTTPEKAQTPDEILIEMNNSIDPDCISKSSGDCFRVRSKNILGSGNIYDGHLCHLAAFACKEHGGEEEFPIDDDE